MSKKPRKAKPSATFHVYVNGKRVETKRVAAHNGPKPDEGKKSRKSA